MAILQYNFRITVIILLTLLIQNGLAFWDIGTTTVLPTNTDTVPRQSFFRWQRTEFEYLRFWFPYWDWRDITFRRCLNVVAGVSIDFLPLSTALILNRRILITAANFIEPYLTRQRDIRIWALGRTGLNYTPYRYRVWTVQRIFPKSLNPEHYHGPRGRHITRHDIAIIHTLDQMYIYSYQPTRYHYAYRTFLPKKHDKLVNVIWYVGSGFESMIHLLQNYKIVYAYTEKNNVVDCSNYLPKWWGKFICVRNVHGHKGIQNGGGFFSDIYLVGLGCFEIRYNDDRIMVFTDLRYYIDYIYTHAQIEPAEYYEYAYPQWSVYLGTFYHLGSNVKVIPSHQIQDDLYPYGKK